MILTPGGGRRTLSVSSSVITLGGREATLNVARDISERIQMQECLTATNQFLASLIDNSSDAIVATDMHGQVLLFNRSAESITGYQAEAFINNRIFIEEFMGKGEVERISALLNSGSPEAPFRLVGDETTLFARDGGVIPISLSISYVYQERCPVATISIFRDLRPIKAVQEKLRESEQKYRILVEQANDGIFVYQDHRFRYTNPKFRQLLGYPEERLTHMGLKDLVYPELADIIEERYAKRIRGERVPEHYEISFVDATGIWKDFEITPAVIEYEGRPATQNIIRDITQRKQAQKALEESEARYRATVEHTGTAMMIFEEDFTIRLVNQQFERLSGYSRAELEGGMRWIDFVHPDDVTRMVGYHQARRSHKRRVPSEYEFRFVKQGGEERAAFITIGLIPGTRRSIASIIDITERKRMEDELAQTRKMAILGEMSAHVAHEVRNPLQKIKTGVELLSLSSTLDSKQRRIIEGVTNGVSNLELFVTQILEWTRSGRLRFKHYRIRNIIDGLLFNHEEDFLVRGITARTDYDKGLDTVQVDGIQLRGAIENIIDNALDAMSSGGTLTVATRRLAEYAFGRETRRIATEALEIHIRDTGSGIAPDDLEKVFQPFFTRKTRGTGLGLALVQKVIHMHHGEVEAYRPENGGAEFVIRLPLDQGVFGHGETAEEA